MKVLTEEQVFSPITIVVESQNELDYLIALSNSSISQVRDGARSLGFTLSSEAELEQPAFYKAMTQLKNN